MSSTWSRRWSRTRRCCTTTVSRRASSLRPRHPPTSPSASSSRWAISRRALPRPSRRRAHVRHRGRAPGLYRAARLRRERHRGRPGRALVLDPGPFHGARPLRRAARHGHLQAPGHAVGDRRRLRRQDDGLSRAGGADAVAKSGRPVKMAMSREEVFRATGPTSGAQVWVKIGSHQAGRITAADAENICN